VSNLIRICPTMFTLNHESQFPWKPIAFCFCARFRCNSPCTNRSKNYVGKICRRERNNILCSVNCRLRFIVLKTIKYGGALCPPPAPRIKIRKSFDHKPAIRLLHKHKMYLTAFKLLGKICCFILSALRVIERRLEALLNELLKAFLMFVIN
jgi:hypothetical protein